MPNYIVAYKPQGCAVINNRQKEPQPIYLFAYTESTIDKIDAERAMRDIAGLLNVSVSPAADARLLESINQQLAKFAQYKVQ